MRCLYCTRSDTLRQRETPLAAAPPHGGSHYTVLVLRGKRISNDGFSKNFRRTFPHRTNDPRLLFFLSVWPSAVDRRCSSGKHCTDLGMQERIGEGIAVRLMAAADDGLFPLLTVVYTSPPPRTLHGGTIESSTDRVTLLRVRPVPPFLCRPLNFDRLVQHTRCS